MGLILLSSMICNIMNIACFTRNAPQTLSHYTLTWMSTEHRCDVPGCGEVLVLDGNMKNSREVCFATDAGHTEFSGLAGMIQTGCSNTPAYKSRYCVLHSPTVTIPHNVQFVEDGTPVTTSNSEETEPRHVAIITKKWVTRKFTFYQVSVYKGHHQNVRDSFHVTNAIAYICWVMKWLYTMHCGSYRSFGWEDPLLITHGSPNLPFLLH